MSIAQHYEDCKLEITALSIENTCISMGKTLLCVYFAVYIYFVRDTSLKLNENDFASVGPWAGPGQRYCKALTSAVTQAFFSFPILCFFLERHEGPRRSY